MKESKALGEESRTQSTRRREQNVRKKKKEKVGLELISSLIFILDLGFLFFFKV